MPMLREANVNETIHHSDAGVLAIRSCQKDMTSYNGFVWPKLGKVTCPDWEPTAECGHGLHALLPGQNSPGEWYNGPILLLRVHDWVKLNGKIKCPEVEVLFCGEMDQVCAEAKEIGCHGPWYYGTATVGDCGTATVGDCGTATAGDYGTATAGYGGKATAGYGGTATVGDRGTATVGDCGTATAGDYGTISIKWHDGKRFRIAVAYVGEDGIKANTPYHIESGKFVEGKQP